jgi:hypothetical protein
VSKLAATLASLLLIASSIGVNIARYPQVGRTVDAPQPPDATEAANSAPAAQPAGPAEMGDPDSARAKATEIRPAKAAQVIAVAPGENARADAPFDPRPAAGTVAPHTVPAATILDVRPMVPVAILRAAAGEADPPAGYDEVRRLPPVEQSVSLVTELPAAGSGEAGQYPATPTP